MLIPIQLAEGKKVPQRVQLLKVGKFLDQSNGDLEISSWMLSMMKQNFDEKVRGYDDGKLPIDYFHENDKIAAGWITGVTLENNGTELWCDVIWTPKAAEALGEGELRYISAEFSFDYQHNEGGQKYGPTLFGAGLTNRPFIKGMNPVANLSEKGKKMTLEQALAQIAEMKTKLEAIEADKVKAETELAETKASAAAEKQLAEKRDSFNKMLASGKACEAQRESFLAGDMVKFAELAKPLNTEAKGSDADAADEMEKKEPSTTPAQDKVMELAETVMKEKKMNLGSAISVVLHSNKELAEQYKKEVAVG